MCSKRVVSELSTWQAEMAYRRRWFTFFVPHPPSGLGQTLRSFENAGRQKVRSLAKNWQTVLGMIACGCRSSSRDHDLHKTYNDCRTMLQHLSFTGCHACRGQLVKVPGKLQANSMLGIQLIKISKNRGEIISLHKSQISQLGYYCTHMHRAAVKFLPLHASALVASSVAFLLVSLSHTHSVRGICLPDRLPALLSTSGDAAGVASTTSRPSTRHASAAAIVVTFASAGSINH